MNYAFENKNKNGLSIFETLKLVQCSKTTHAIPPKYVIWTQYE